MLITMTFSPVSEELFAELTKPRDIREKVSPICTCGVRYTNGYCRNKDCPVDLPIATEICKSCGHCSTPNRCVRSVQCPLCFRAAGSGCVRPTDSSSPDAYHELRWQLVKDWYGVYYK